MITSPVPLLFGLDESHEANEWRFNCGPGALCGVLSMTPAQLRPHMLDFEQKGYTNPTLMFDVLKGLKVEHKLIFRTDDPQQEIRWPSFGLCRVQWHGPWMRAGVPMKARYRKTHWIGASGDDASQRLIFDINAIEWGGWLPFQTWDTQLVPWLLNEVQPDASGSWHITHSIEIPRP